MQGEISRKNSWFTKSTGCCYQAIAKIFQHNLIKYCEIKHLRQNHTLNQNFTISTWQQRQWTFLLMTTEHVWIQTGTYISAHPNQISRIHPSSLMQYASPARQMKPVMTIKPAGRQDLVMYHNIWNLAKIPETKVTRLADDQYQGCAVGRGLES